MPTWPAPVVRLFLGYLSPAETLAAADFQSGTCSVDLADLRRWHMLDPARLASTGKMPAVTWNTFDGFDQLGVLMRPNGVLFVRRDDGGQLGKLFVSYVFTPTKFGGWRAWFRCPGCGLRCRVLYGINSLRCRKCRGLKYQSQYETPAYRSAADNAHDKETTDKNPERPSTLPRAEPDLSGAEGPAQTLEGEHTERERDTEVDGDLGDSRDINDEQANADKLPVRIDAQKPMLPNYERAKQALAQCEDIDVCKNWANKAEAIAAYAQLAKCHRARNADLAPAGLSHLGRGRLR
jgi:hypothetical protein